MVGETTPASASAPNGWRLGHTSESYESSGRGPGTVSSGRGDAGGQSYGNWQLSSNEGTLGEYLRQSRYKEQFKGLELGSPDFNAKWREVAKTDPTGFQQDQCNFIKASHFDKQVERLKADGLDLSSRGPAVQDALWSTSVQYRGLTKGIVEKGLEDKFGKDYDLTKLSDKDIVTAVQDYKIGHNETLMGRNSAAVRASVKGRAENEKADLLSLADGKLVHHGGHAHKPASIGEIQTKLGQLGYTNPDKTPLATDGHMGRNTRDALKAFQHDHHLKETGTTDPATLKAIDTTLKERGVQRQAAPTTEQSNDRNRWGPPQITDLAHPGNPLFKQAQTGMQAIDAKYGR
ncbi:peptidoglycan-binding domain-containing protein, partial [Variovorax sp. DXTD-1]|uniref:peptidoglycan-binding domain-containing protein n=1 Tax=Variovorax sp. DXTD-1 TaxID=2495592 RepID=UPI000F9EBE6C